MLICSTSQGSLRLRLLWSNDVSQPLYNIQRDHHVSCQFKRSLVISAWYQMTSPSTCEEVTKLPTMRLVRYLLNSTRYMHLTGWLRLKEIPLALPSLAGMTLTLNQPSTVAVFLKIDAQPGKSALGAFTEMLHPASPTPSSPPILRGVARMGGSPPWS